MPKKPLKHPIGRYLRQEDAPEWMRSPGHKNVITPAVAEELKALGFPIPDWVEVLAPDEETIKTALYICRPIEEGHPESLPDNAVGKCSLCSRRIEFRPSAPPGITKICSICAEARAKSPEN